MSDQRYAPLVTDEHIDLIRQTIALRDKENTRWLRDAISFGCHHYLEDNCIATGVRMSDVRKEIKYILSLLRKANQRIESLHPLLRVFLFKYPAGMTDGQVREWFGPKIITAGDRSLTSMSAYSNKELFFRFVFITAAETSKILQQFFEEATSAPLRGPDGKRINARRSSCVAYFALIYSEFTGLDPRGKLSYDEATKCYDSPFFRFMEIIFAIVEPGHGMKNHALGYLIRAVLGPKRGRARRRARQRAMQIPASE